MFVIYFLGLNNFDKRQNLIPLARIGRDVLDAFVNKRQGGGMVPFPRVGRNTWEGSQGFLPYPRIGRTADQTESLDYDILLHSDNVLLGREDGSLSPVSNIPISGNLASPINRKKRSVSEEPKKQDLISTNKFSEIMKSDYTGSSWDNSEEKRAIFIPRIGRSSYTGTAGIRGTNQKNKHNSIFRSLVGRK